jgi:hypothetical protein
VKTKKLHFNPEYNTVNANNECARFVRNLFIRLSQLDDMVAEGQCTNEGLELEITNIVRQASGSFEVL